MSRSSPAPAEAQQVDLLFVHVVAFHRKKPDFLNDFASYKGQESERNVNVTLVAGAKKETAPSLLKRVAKRVAQKFSISRSSSSRPQVTPHEVSEEQLEDLHPTLIFSQEMPTWNYPALVLDADARFIGYWPEDARSDRYDFMDEVDEGKFGYERARTRAARLLDDEEKTVDDYSRVQDIAKKLETHRPKNTLEAAVQKMVEISQGIDDLTSGKGKSKIETGYYNKGEEITQLLEDNDKIDFYKRSAKEKTYLRHNECHIRAKIHNIQYVAYTEDQGPIVTFQALILVDKINKLKEEILEEHKIAEQKGQAGARVQELIKFEEDNYVELQNKIKAIEGKILLYQENLESEKAESFNNSDLDEAMQRKEGRYKGFEPTPQNRTIWLGKNIDKLKQDLEDLQKIKPTSKEIILAKLQTPTKLRVYSLEAEKTFSKGDVESLKKKIIEVVDNEDGDDANLDNLTYMGYGEFEDRHFDETFFKAKKERQKEALFHNNFNARTNFVEALISKGRLNVIRRIFEDTLSENEALNAICKNDLLAFAIANNQQEIFNYFWSRLSEKQASFAKLESRLLQTAKTAIMHNNEEALSKLIEQFKGQIQRDYLVKLLEDALQNNKISMAQKLMESFPEDNLKGLIDRTANNNIFHLMARFCKEDEAQKVENYEDVLLRVADRIFGNLPQVVRKDLIAAPHFRENLNPLELAIKNGNLVMTRFFLTRFEAFLPEFDHDKIFNLACESRSLEMVEFFFKQTPFAQNKDSYAMKLLKFAVEKNCEELAGFAIRGNNLDLFAEYKISVKSQEEELGVTAFKHAILRNNPEMLRFLLRTAKEQSASLPSAKIKIQDYKELENFTREAPSSIVAKSDDDKEIKKEKLVREKMIKIIKAELMSNEGRSVVYTHS